MTVGDDVLRRLVALHADALARLPNVVGVGMTRDDDGTGVVSVYVARKVAAAGLTREQRIPERVEATIDGEQVEAPTRVVEVGDITH